jgi:hypothetical protein
MIFPFQVSLGIKNCGAITEVFANGYRTTRDIGDTHITTP